MGNLIGQRVRSSQIVDILIVRGAPRHARVVDQDMDLFFLGPDGFDEAVAPSLGLDIRRGVRIVNQIFLPAHRERWR